MTVPRIIHQIWYQGAGAVPGRYRAYAEGWRTRHPTWAYRLWDYHACRALLTGRYPGHLALWDGYPLDIQRIDSARYFILNAHGGVYLDMDMECLKPLDPLLEDCDFLLSQTVQFNNAVIASSAGHAFWERVLPGLTAADRRPRPRGLGKGARFAAETVGPIFFSRMVRDHGLDRDPRTRVCPGDLFEPHAPVLIEGRPTFTGDTSRSYAIHHEDMRWLPFFPRSVSRISRPLLRLLLARRK
jgi:hypothetical protein